jgi:hypothetical protein
MADDTTSAIATVRTGSIGNDLSNHGFDDEMTSELSGMQSTAPDQTRREQDHRLKAAFLATKPQTDSLHMGLAMKNA